MLKRGVILRLSPVRFRREESPVGENRFFAALGMAFMPDDYMKTEREKMGENFFGIVLV